MSQLKVDFLSTRAGTRQNSMLGQAKAWGALDGTGTIAILASFNVTSYTDNGTGDYTENRTAAFSSTTYATVTGCPTAADFNALNIDVGLTAPTALVTRFRTIRISSVAAADIARQCIGQLGTLA